MPHSIKKVESPANQFFRIVLVKRGLAYGRRSSAIVASTVLFPHSSIGQHNQTGLYPLRFRILLRVLSMSSLHHAGGLVTPRFE